MFTDRNLLLAVIGLVVLALFVASLYRKYQESQAIRRQRIAMLLAGVEQLERVLDRIHTLGLSRELRVLLRGDLVRRLRAVQAVFPGYPGIQGRIRQARSQMDAEGPAAPARQQSTDKAMLSEQLNALAELRHILTAGGLSKALDGPALQGFLSELDAARLRIQFDYHLAMYEAYRSADSTAQARSHLMALGKLVEAAQLPGEDIESMRQEVQRLNQRELGEALKAEPGAAHAAGG